MDAGRLMGTIRETLAVNQFLAALLLAVMLLSACSREEPARPMVEVVVDTVVEEPYQHVYRHVGRLQAVNDVAIQARVTGYLKTQDFKEGELVNAGEVLYTIDASETDAALARAKAELTAAQALQANAQGNFQRGQDLFPKGAIPKSEMDNLSAQKRDADARIEAAEAQVTSAEVNLGYTTIRAPITGRIGYSSVSVGDLVGPNSGNLTTLVSIDPIEARFQISEANYVAALGNDLSKQRDKSQIGHIEVTVELTNGLVYPEVGRITYIDNRINQTTGTLEARASIPNPHSALVPGQYVRVLLTDTELSSGLFIPQSAVQADQQGSFVLAVDSNGTVVRHNVDLGERRDDRVLVRSGVVEGEQVIVRGLQQVRPGLTVKTKSVSGVQDAG
jgi:membrane fusion protein (multidrug efflux system)